MPRETRPITATMYSGIFSRKRNTWTEHRSGPPTNMINPTTARNLRMRMEILRRIRTIVYADSQKKHLRTDLSWNTRIHIEMITMFIQDMIYPFSIFVDEVISVMMILSLIILKKQYPVLVRISRCLLTLWISTK